MSNTSGTNGKDRGRRRAPQGRPPALRLEEQALIGQFAPAPAQPESNGGGPDGHHREPLASISLPDPRYRARPMEVRSEVHGLNISENSSTVLQRRYLAKDREGRVIEEPEEMFRRVARNLAEAELLEPDADVSVAEGFAEEFYQLLSNLEFLPNSPTLMNAGRELQQLSACFVLPVPDDMEGIFESAKHTALIHKSGGGTGFAFSRLRPESDIVGSTGGIASGPVSFIKIFDTATDVVKQGGTRRGANMGILNIEHPDIRRFIQAKDDDQSLQNFNISVALTEKFMQAVEAGADYDLVNPRTGEHAGRLNAKQVFDELVQSAWKTGDPGIIFIDRMNEPGSSPVPKRGPIEATNPCGEQPLYPYDSCNLGSINLAKMVTDDSPCEIDWGKLEKTVFTSVRLLDNVVAMNRYPIPQIEEVSKGIRRIGLGVMGWADLLLLLGIPYDSEDALVVGEGVMSFIQEKANEASAALAEEREVFPDWEDSVYGPRGPLGPQRLRNSTRTTIAPTGTISIIANCSSGIEPLFALSYVRNVMDNTRLVEVNPYFEEVARREGFYTEELMQELAERGSVRGMPGVPDWVQRLFATAHDITPQWHARMQGAFQRYTDNAVSKTVNFPNVATAEDVHTVYMLAYKLGCKGVTIYRDGSKSAQVLSTGHTEKVRAGADGHEPAAELPSAVREAESIASGPVPRMPRERPTSVTGLTHRVRTGHGNMYITINFDETGRPFEVFSTLGKAGGCDSAQLEGISRLASLAMRSGVDIESIMQQLRGITCCPAWDQGIMVRSAPDAVALALAKHAKKDSKATPAWDEPTMSGAQLGLFKQSSGESLKHEHGAEMAQRMSCPDCGGRLAYQEGCLMCHGCGFNKCG